MSTLKVTNISPQSGNNVYLTGSLIVSNVLRAREVVTTISSSQVLVSGSTKFGDTNDDNHIFTGSVSITGSVSADDYTGIFNGALSSSAQIADNISGSFGAASASFSSRLTTAESELGNTLLSSSAQIASDISGSFVAASSSIAVDIDALQLFSTSLDATYATDAQLATATASLSSSLATDIATNLASVVSLTSATSSYALSANVVANSSTASFASTGSNTFTGNQVVSASVLLTLQQLTGSMPTGVATGSLIVSGSPVQLYIYNGSGSGWNRV